MFLKIIKKNMHQEWIAYTKHKFGELIATGKLSKKAFDEYIRQDIFYLHHYAKCWNKVALLTANNKWIQYAQKQAIAIIGEEMKFRKQYQIQDLKEINVLSGTKAYVDYMNKIAKQNDYNKLFFALLACFVGYAYLGKYILTFKIHKKYQAWISIYISNDFFKASDEIMATAFKIWNKSNLEEQNEYLTIIKQTLVLEKNFFDQVL